MKTCKTCVWWDIRKTHPGEGQCRVNAPMTGVIAWPLTAPDDFCAAHDDAGA